MMLIGIAGNKGHGKDTVGRMLAQKYDFSPIAFADPIKEAVKVALDMSDTQVYGTQEQKEAVDPRYGFSPRHAMQTLGTEWGRDLLREDIWPTVLWAKIESAKARGFDRFCITDVRFPNEADQIRERGGIIIKVVRPGVETDAHSTHASETLVDSLKVDYVIDNSGTLDDLSEAVDVFMTGYLGAWVNDAVRTAAVRHVGLQTPITEESLRNLIGKIASDQPVTVEDVEFSAPDKYAVTLSMPRDFAEEHGLLDPSPGPGGSVLVPYREQDQE